MYEVTLRLEHDCPYTAFSKRYPSVLVQHWCSMERDVLQFHRADDVDAGDLRRGMKQLGRALGSKFTRVVSATPGSTIVVQKHLYSSMDSNVNSFIERFDCMEVQPTVYKEGYEWYRVLAFRQSDLLKLFRALSRTMDLHVTSRRTIPDRSVGDTMMVSVNSLLGGLTKKQLGSLLAALDHGYYNVPRRVTTAEISSHAGSPRTTFEGHLRKAEGKVLRAMVPYLELSLHGHEPED
jgi:predicted DNA binding protein